MAFSIKKLNALPGALLPDTMYLIKNGTSGFKIFVTNSAGTIASSNTPTAVDINRYDLPIAATTGVMDLSVNQVYKVDLTTAGARTMSFTNAPANTKAMVIVIETVGNLGTIILPGVVTAASGVETTPGAIRSVFTIFFDGTNYTLVSNSKVD